MEACKYCGSADRHREDCPVLQAQRKEAMNLLDEVVAEQKQAAAEAAENKEPHRPDKGEISQAREVVQKLLEAQVFPKVTISREHLDEILKNGLRELPTAYQKNIKMIVGTIAREPLLPETQDRVILEIQAEPDEVEPRFTGRENTFQGIVRIKGPTVPPDKIKVIDPKRTDRAA